MLMNEKEKGRTGCRRFFPFTTFFVPMPPKNHRKKMVELFSQIYPVIRGEYNSSWRNCLQRSCFQILLVNFGKSCIGFKHTGNEKFPYLVLVTKFAFNLLRQP